MLVYLFSLLAILLAIYRWLTKDHGYFDAMPFPSLPSKPIVGGLGELIAWKYSISDYIKKVYDQFEGSKVFGFFDMNVPVYVIRDPNLVKQLMIKDFDYFMDHKGTITNNSDSPHVLFPKGLFSLTGQKWRNMRGTLSPAFTGSKMRQMFGLVVDCAETTVDFYRNETMDGLKQYEMKDIFSRFSNDVIATCAFGFKVDSRKERENDFFINGQKAMNFNRLTILFRIGAYKFLPKLMSKFEIDVIDREQNVYFSAIIRDAVKQREATGIVRYDMVNLLMQARKGALKHSEASEESEIVNVTSTATITEPEMIAQCLIFFLAGFDTVSTCLTFLSYELAINPEIQQRLYQEVLATKDSLNGDQSLTYEAVQKMKYLDQCISESLRMWSPLAVTDRICVKDYHLDDGEGLQFTIKKDCGLWIPIHGLHRDPKFYTSPDQFDPDRFSEENRDKIVPGTYLPFGIGPRNCIGSRFALMEVKAIIYYILLNFSLERTAQTQVPIVLAKGIQGINAENGMHLGLKPRKE